MKQNAMMILNPQAYPSNNPVTQADKNRGKTIHQLLSNFCNYIDRLKNARENQNIKKNNQIDSMQAEDVLQDLKNRGLPTFGTNQERRDRLKKHYGI